MAIPDAHNLPHEERASKAQQERRGTVDTRGRMRLFWDVVFAIVRGIARLAKNFYATFGIILSAGAFVALGGTYLFAEFAGHVSSGKTQAFDDSVLRWGWSAVMRYAFNVL